MRAPNGGLPRAERELSATATSRHNGCIFCASVHSRFASTHSKRRDDIQRLLDDGIGADLGPRWNAVKDAAVALTDTPARLGEEEIANLRAAGLDDFEITDVISAAAFFNWANRLMLSLGEPVSPQSSWPKVGRDPYLMSSGVSALGLSASIVNDRIGATCRHCLLTQISVFMLR